MDHRLAAFPVLQADCGPEFLDVLRQLRVLGGAVLRRHQVGQRVGDRVQLVLHRVVRPLREQIDWDRVRKETAGSPYAEAFLVLLDRLDVVGAG